MRSDAEGINRFDMVDCVQVFCHGDPEDDHDICTLAISEMSGGNSTDYFRNQWWEFHLSQSQCHRFSMRLFSLFVYDRSIPCVSVNVKFNVIRFRYSPFLMTTIRRRR